MHLGAGGADFLDQRDHPVHLAVGGLVDQIGAIGRPVGMDQQLFAAAGQRPKLLGDEGHDRVQEGESLVKHPGHGGAGLGGMVALHQGLGKLHIPVADLAPGEGVERVRRVVEAEGGQRLVDRDAGARRLADDPAVDGMGGCGNGGHRRGGEDAVHFGKAGGVPELGGEVPVAGDAVLREFQVAPHGGHRGHGKAQGIGAEFVDEGEGVDDVAQGFRHLPALLVPHQRVDIDGVEGDLIDHGKLHHHHPGDPEEDDVEAGDEDVGGEVFPVGFGVLGPAEGADRPEAGGEPGVEDVGVAVEFEFDTIVSFHWKVRVALWTRDLKVTDGRRTWWPKRSKFDLRAARVF